MVVRRMYVSSFQVATKLASADDRVDPHATSGDSGESFPSGTEAELQWRDIRNWK